jgi:ABC-type branched-subunit amino acid transport system substrate-binding protein
MVSNSSAYSIGLAKFFREAFTANGGTIVLEQKYAEGDKDFKAQLTAIKAAGVDAVFNPGYYNEGALIVLQARDLGLTLPIFGADSWEAEALIELGGKAIEGAYLCSHYSPADPSSRVQNFVQAYKKRFGTTPDSNASLGYDSVLVLVDAIKRAGSTERAKIRDALAATNALAQGQLVSEIFSIQAIDATGLTALATAAFDIVGQSDRLPMMMPTTGDLEDDVMRLSGPESRVLLASATFPQRRGKARLIRR